MAQFLFQCAHGVLDFAAGIPVQGLARLAAQGGIYAIQRSFRRIEGFQRSLALLVLARKGGGVAHGFLDLVLAQVRGTGDRNALLLAGVHVAGADLDDAVGVDVKGHFNFGHARPGTLDAPQREGTQQLIVLGKLPLALQYFDFYGALERRGRGEHLAEAGGNGGVALDQVRSYAAQRLDGEGQRGHVHQQQILACAGQCLAAQAACLHGGAQGHALVGVQGFGRFQPGHPHNFGLHGRDAGRAAHQQHLVQVAGGQVGVAQRIAHGQGGPFDEVGAQLLKLGAGQGGLQVQCALRPGGDERQVQLGLGGGGKLFLRLFGFLPQALHGHAVGGQVHTVGSLEVVRQPIHDAGIEVVAAEVVIAAGGKHLHDAIADLDQGYVKSAAAQVVDHDGLGLAVVQAVGQGRGGRLVDDALDFQPGDASGILGGLALGIVKVGRHRDDGLGDRLAKIGLGVRFEFLQDQGADLLGRIALAVNGHAAVTAHLALDAGDGARRVGDGLALGGFAHQALARFGECHHRRRGALALGIGDHHRFTALDDRGAAVGSAQINPDHFCHGCVVPSLKG